MMFFHTRNFRNNTSLQNTAPLVDTYNRDVAKDRQRLLHKLREILSEFLRPLLSAHYDLTKIAL